MYTSSAPRRLQWKMIGIAVLTSLCIFTAVSTVALLPAHATTRLQHTPFRPMGTSVVDCKTYLNQFANQQGTLILNVASQLPTGVVGYASTNLTYYPAFNYQGYHVDASFVGSGPQTFSDRNHFDANQADQLSVSISLPTAGDVNVTFTLLSWGNATYSFTPQCTPNVMYGSVDGSSEQTMSLIQSSGPSNKNVSSTWVPGPDCGAWLDQFATQTPHHFTVTMIDYAANIDYAQGTIQYYSSIRHRYRLSHLATASVDLFTGGSDFQNVDRKVHLSIDTSPLSGHTLTLTLEPNPNSSKPQGATFEFSPTCANGVLYSDTGQGLLFITMSIYA